MRGDRVGQGFPRGGVAEEGEDDEGDALEFDLCGGLEGGETVDSFLFSADASPTLITISLFRTLPAHLSRTAANAGHVNSTCLGSMLIKCVRSAAVPCA